jgi:hypothetical protein
MTMPLAMSSQIFQHNNHGAIGDDLADFSVIITDDAIGDVFVDISA